MPRTPPAVLNTVSIIAKYFSILNAPIVIEKLIKQNKALLKKIK
jgi:hypothetical protein